MMEVTDLFTERDRDIIYGFYEGFQRAKDVKRFRDYDSQHGSVDTIFYGDSIFQLWPTEQAFPELSHLNRGIGGDNIDGLYHRLNEDIFPNNPKNVVINIGINGIGGPVDVFMEKYRMVALLMKERGINVWCNSIAPVRHGDTWNRFQYLDLIVEENARIRELCEKELAGYFDLHSILKDEAGELAAQYAQDDGTHWTHEAYLKVSPILRAALVH